MSTHKAFQMNSLSQGRCALESNGSLADLLGQGVDYVVPGSPPGQEFLFLYLCLKCHLGLAVTVHPVPSLIAFCPTEMTQFWLAGECPFLFTD